MWADFYSIFLFNFLNSNLCNTLIQVFCFFFSFCHYVLLPVVICDKVVQTGRNIANCQNLKIIFFFFFIFFKQIGENRVGGSVKLKIKFLSPKGLNLNSITIIVTHVYLVVIFMFIINYLQSHFTLTATKLTDTVVLKLFQPQW